VTLTLEQGATRAVANGGAAILDGLIASGGGTADMRTVVTALGRLSTEGDVLSAVAQTLPALIVNAPTLTAVSQSQAGRSIRG